MQVIDVVMITKNSVHPYLEESLSSILRNVPLKQLVVVDSFSTDGTIELINRFQEKGVKIKVIQEECKRGKAREIGIGEVSTEFFAFVDSDVILAENWFVEIIKHITPEIGAIEGKVGKMEVNPEGRAYTNCTLIRTILVKDISIPEDMHVYEDQYIRKHIEGKEFKWLKVHQPCSIHESHSDHLKDMFEIGRMAGKYRLLPFWKNLAVCFLIPVKYFKYGDSPRLYLYKLYGHVKGILEGTRKNESARMR